MGVFFNPLFKKLAEENILPVELQNCCHISSTTIAQMRRGECVPLESLIKICEYLECDFGDIMTVNPPKADPFDPIHFTKNIKSAIKVYRAALKDFMSESGVTINDICQISGLSLNTVKNIFDIKSSVSLNSVKKLNNLGDRYLQILHSYLVMYINGIEISFQEDVDELDERGYYISKILRHYLDDNVAVFVQEALLNLIKEEGLTKKELAQGLGMSINTLNSVLDRDIKSANTLEKILVALPFNMVKQLYDLIDDETPERRKAPFRSYMCENCRAYNYADNSCYLEYSNAIGEDGKYHSTDVCTHPKTFTLLFEEADERGIELKTHAKRVYDLKKQDETDSSLQQSQAEHT